MGAKRRRQLKKARFWHSPGFRPEKYSAGKSQKEL
ncbi:hypothetical protein ALO_11814 [Acetonema longum DSM 6540]|uniref:Uncharacterized protein n=1 Tax=Acetonema longum DSM 6540 TaxID=1009370 RepID=F7NJV3_9FIRM|nr:hypothetical protein ALO_11814 [Acetonema longum DSM 6540]